MPTIIGSGVGQMVNAANSNTLALNISATGTDRCLVVGTFVYAGSNPSTSDIASVTYNGTSLTAGSSNHGTINVDGVIRWWRLLNPPTGSSFNIVASTTSSSVEELIIMAAAFSDVDQTTPFGTAVGTNGTAGTSSTGTVSLSGSDIALAVFTGYRAAGAYTITPNGTGIVEQENGNLFTTWGFQSRSNATLGWTMSASVDAFQQYSIPLKHTGGGASTWGPLMAMRNNRLVSVF